MLSSTCLLTYNVYFENIAMRMRMAAIARTIEKYRPAVIALQEVTPEILQILSGQSWFQYYDCSTSVVPPCSSAYFVVLLSALPIVSLKKHVFNNSGMGRELIYAKLRLDDNKTIVVGTSHLESLPAYAQKRHEQLKRSLQILSSETVDPNCMGAIFMGDTNILNGELLRFDSSLKAAGKAKVEVAKSNRSQCRECNQKIAQNEVRIAKISIPSGQVREEARWHHVKCFFATASHGITSLSMVKAIPGYESLCDDDKSFLENTAFTVGGIQEGQSRLSAKNCIGLPSGWEDVWLSLDGNTEENGYTYNGKTNRMIQHSHYQSRFDRILIFRSPNFPLSKVLEVNIVGTKSIDEGKKIWPSDHYGLQSVIKWN